VALLRGLAEVLAAADDPPPSNLTIDVTMEVYTEVSDANTLKALKRLGEQLDS
jgi:hypothetical protein